MFGKVKIHVVSYQTDIMAYKGLEIKKSDLTTANVVENVSGHKLLKVVVVCVSDDWFAAFTRHASPDM